MLYTLYNLKIYKTKQLGIETCTISKYKCYQLVIFPGISHYSNIQSPKYFKIYSINLNEVEILNSMFSYVASLSNI